MSGSDLEGGRGEIENYLRARLNDAKQSYDRAVARYRTLIAAPPEHDPVALRLATAEYHGAIERYAKALREFAAFLLEGKIPEGGPS